MDEWIVFFIGGAALGDSADVKSASRKGGAVLFAQQLSLPRRAIFQALPLAQKQSAKNRNFLFHHLLLLLVPSPLERERQDKLRL